ncbi:MAG: DDE-type integrase/transposase/recombinase [Pseudonocardiaceae bacterium]
MADILQDVVGAQPPGVIFHTDRGSTYTANEFTTLCTRLDIRQSMGRVGSCFDNAVAESFFSTLEHEVLSQVGDRGSMATSLRERIAANTAAAGLPQGRLAEAFQVVVNR